jgi:hypothetical protein
VSEKTNTAKKKVAVNKPTKAEGGVVTLQALAAELKIEPRAARIKLRNAELKREGRWAWKAGSAELTKVRKLLS